MFVLPTETIFYSIERAIKSYRKLAQKRISEVAPDITLDQTLLLLLIDDQPKLSQVRLAELLFKDYASMTRMIVLLVNNGFLQRKRHPTDGRRSRLTITSKGKNILNSLRQVIARNRETAIAGLTPEQLNKLKTSLLTISGNCEQDEEFTTVFTLITK
jgi:DNA-binding MarR family transcriptional regulator